jgi:hypothetical protein
MATDSAGQPFVVVPPARPAGDDPPAAGARAGAHIRRAAATETAATETAATETAATETAAPGAGGAPTSTTSTSTPGDRVRWRRRVLLAGIGTVTVVGIGLAVAGLSLVRNSTLGRYEQALGPTDPGYQAYVARTPTLAVVHRGPDGALAGLALLSLEAGDRGGTAVVVPPSLLTDTAPTATTTIADIYRDEGAAGAADALGRVLAAAAGERIEVDDAHWARLVEPVAPLELTLPEPVGEWPAGDVRLEPDEIGRFLATLAPGETDIDRIERQELFWSAWLEQVGDAGQDAVPGEESTGLGRFVRGIARGPARIQELPIKRDDRPSGLYLRPNDTRVPEVMTDAVPFPTSPAPATRVRVRLLNGTEDTALTTDAARFLVMGGAEIIIVGNAATLDVAETTVSYSDPEREGLAGWVAGLFGLTGIEELPAGDEEVDATVILGDDARDLIRR